jgi:hypothetical protein
MVSDEDDINITSDVYLSKDILLIQNLDSTAKIMKSQVNTKFIITISLETGKTYYWTVIPYDGKAHGNCTNGIWAFKVAENATTNHLPRFVSNPPLVAVINTQWSYEPQALDDDAGDFVSIKLLSRPTGMQFVGKILTWTPDANQIGNYTVKLEATDGKGSTYQEFKIKVTSSGSGNHMPIIDLIQNTTIMAGEKLSIQVKASDQDGDKLSYSIQNGPAGVQINGTGLLTWQTNKSDEGTHQITVKVSDGKISTTKSFTLTVKKAGSNKPWLDNLSLVLIGIIIAVMAIIAAIIIISRSKRKGKSPNLKS